MGAGAGHPVAPLVVSLATVAWLTVLCGHDLRHRRLPNTLTLPGAAALLAAATVAGHGAAALAGALTLAGIYLAVHLVAPAALGAGDVKLALGVGAWTGWFGAPVWALAALGAPLLTAVVALVAGCRGAHAIPHGPSLGLAGAAAVALALL
ncbi:A24 family peptidase [Mycolicibacillus koreensis]|uniref:A24 family peptidase n=1 Tax=Mycolicibacillus koreensis TaxID=1069220 RepID=UPI00138CB494|nr:A24 family peptidase [Mycolicibacillus koreensis]BBY53848.1 prepilin peptidase [Mycolicibacillus koreensis]